MTWGEFVSLLMAIAAIITAVIVARKFKPEERGMDADTMTKYQTMLKNSASRELELMTKIDALEKRVEILEKQHEADTLLLKNSIKKSERFEGYIQLLIYQIKSLGGTPMDMPTEP